jgi:hypothetical protein
MGLGFVLATTSVYIVEIATTGTFAPSFFFKIKITTSLKVLARRT